MLLSVYNMQSMSMIATSYFVTLYKEMHVTFFFCVGHSIYQFLVW